ncbi:MAG: 30S ribosomal protein S9 [bacterium]
MAKTTTTSRYLEAVGRRKTSIARVRITEADKTSMLINDKDYTEFLATDELQHVAMESLTKSLVPAKFMVTVKVLGGGVHSQAEAIRLGVARALIIFDPELRKTLKDFGFLMRDPRAKERRKFGLKKARKSPQWSKR